MISKNIAVSNPFFHKKIIDKSEKWTIMGVRYPLLVYNIASTDSAVPRSKIYFFLSLQMQRQIRDFDNFLWNCQNLALVRLTKDLSAVYAHTLPENRSLAPSSKSIFPHIENTVIGKIEGITEIIKDSGLLFVSKIPKSLSNKTDSGFFRNINIFKKLHFLNNLALLSRASFTRSTIALKVLEFFSSRKSLRSSYFSNGIGSLNNSVFLTGNNPLENFSFSNVVCHIRGTFLSKVFNSAYSQFFFKYPLRMNFSAGKRKTEFQIVRSKSSLTQESNRLNAQDLGEVHSESGHIRIFPSQLLNLPLNNLNPYGRKAQLSTAVDKVPVISKEAIMLSFSDLESGNRKIASVHYKKQTPRFTLANEPGSEWIKDWGLPMNTKNLVFHTRSSVEQKIEAKIEQKVEQKVEQVKKAVAKVKEEILEQNEAIYSRIRENQKQQYDINHISDQIFRLMEHRLKIERERRGIL